MAYDPHWIEHAKLKKGAYGHHTAKVIAKDSKKKGLIGRRARAAHTLATLRSRAHNKLHK